MVARLKFRIRQCMRVDRKVKFLDVKKRSRIFEGEDGEKSVRKVTIWTALRIAEFHGIQKLALNVSNGVAP